MTEQQVCPLCEITKQVGDFRKSHFMPGSLYHSGKKGLQYGTRTGAGRLEKEIKDLLLCSTCESVLDHGGESYVLSQIAAKVTKEFPLHRKLILLYPAKVIRTSLAFPEIVSESTWKSSLISRWALYGERPYTIGQCQMG